MNKTRQPTLGQVNVGDCDMNKHENNLLQKIKQVCEIRVRE